jgi:hypothetical protein
VGERGAQAFAAPLDQRGEAAGQLPGDDSDSALAGIKQANQGVFVILPRDQAPGIVEGSQPEKVVRVVSTVQYFLD